MPPPPVRRLPGFAAIWGSTDLPGVGDQVLARVLEHQLRLRLPDHRTVLFAPFGVTRPTVADGGVVARPLGTGARAALTVVCPGFPVGSSAAELVDRYGTPDAAPAARWFSTGLADGPLVWTAVRVPADPSPEVVATVDAQPWTSVRDRVSLERLRRAGVRGDVAVVGHPGLLAGELVDESVRHNRLRVLRQLGLLPAGEYVVLDGAAATADGLAARLSDLAEHVIGLAPDLVLEDRVAVLSGAVAVVAGDEHVAAVAAGLGVRWALFDPSTVDHPVVAEFGGAEQLVVDPAQVAAALRTGCAPTAVTALTDHLDRVARLAAADLTDDIDARLADVVEENRALRMAIARLRAQSGTERQRLVEALADERRARDEALAALADAGPASNPELAARLAEAQRELAAWRNTKLVRWSSPLRGAYGRLRKA